MDKLKLLRAAKQNNKPLVEHILSIVNPKYGINTKNVKLKYNNYEILNETDIDEYTPLHFAVLNINLPMIEMLLTAGSDANLRTRDELKTPLHIALDLYISIAETEKINEKDKLERAYKLKSIINLLLEYGAYAYANDDRGISFGAIINHFQVDRSIKSNSSLRILLYSLYWLQRPLELKTLVARALVKNNLTEIPKLVSSSSLHQFVKLHSPLEETRGLLHTSMILSKLNK